MTMTALPDAPGDGGALAAQQELHHAGVIEAAERHGVPSKLWEHRQRLRAQGMQPIQIWVSDVHSPPRHGGSRCWWRRAQRRPTSRPSSIR
jgi:hypothetical protein